MSGIDRIADTWTDDDFADENLDECGLTRDQFAAALSCWSWMQQRPTTVGEAAKVFNTSIGVVAEAVLLHEYLLMGGGEGENQIIEHDGE